MSDVYRIPNFGTISGPERRLIDGVIDFRKTRAHDLMRPWTDVVFVRPETLVAEMVRLASEHHLAHIPVLGEDGRVSGRVTIQEVMLDTTRPGIVAACQRRTLTIEPDASSYTVLRRLRISRVGLAVVAASDGVPLGIVDQEDVLLRLVRSTG